MDSQGKKGDLDREIRYRKLLTQVTGTAEACRLVGASRLRTFYGAPSWTAQLRYVYHRARPLPLLACTITDRLLTYPWR